MTKTLNVDDDLHARLTDLGTKSETYNDILRRILDRVENEEKN